MVLLITLIVVSLFAVVGSSLIKKCSGIFYALAIVLSGIYLFYRFFAAYDPLIFSLLQVVQKGLIAYSFFAIVMFIGVFDDVSWVRKRLLPIRGELSLLGFVFALGHAGGYLTSYLTTIIRDSGIIPHSAFASMLISLISLVLLLILGITTFNFVRSRMNTRVWKRIQRLSYVFFGLVHVHLMLMLMPTIRTDVTDALVSASMYIVILVSYVILRVSKAVRDKMHKNTSG